MTTTTATDGRYQFSSLPAGDYTVRVTPPVGTTPTADNDGIAGASANQSSLSLPPNTTRILGKINHSVQPRAKPCAKN
ncbi:MAG: SdrD B-like domain-containing protein [Cyanobacteria bacterium P01_H01_bin.121]